MPVDPFEIVSSGFPVRAALCSSCVVTTSCQNLRLLARGIKQANGLLQVVMELLDDAACCRYQGSV